VLPRYCIKLHERAMGRFVQWIERNPAPGVSDCGREIGMGMVMARQPFQGGCRFALQQLGLKEDPFIEWRCVAQGEAGEECVRVEGYERVVAEMAADVDLLYIDLYKRFGLQLPVMGEPIEMEVSDEPSPCVALRFPNLDRTGILVPAPDRLPRTEGVTSGEQLTLFVMAVVSQKIVRDALSQADILPAWSLIADQLRAYPWLDAEIARWCDASDAGPPAAPTGEWTLQQALGRQRIRPAPNQQPPLASARPNEFRLMVAGAAMAYVVEVYGTEMLGPWIAEMERYDSWEGLAPTAFGVSVAEFERGWRAYQRGIPSGAAAEGDSHYLCVRSVTVTCPLPHFALARLKRSYRPGYPSVLRVRSLARAAACCDRPGTAHPSRTSWPRGR
jgi:hypothetical protein